MSLGLAIGTTILFYKYYTLGNSAAFEEKDSHSSQDFFALSSSRPTCWINASKDCLMSIWKVSNLCFNSWSSKQSNWQCYQTTIRNLPSVLQNDYISLHGGYFRTEGVFTWENLHRREFHIGMTFWFHIAFTEWPGHFISHYLKVHFMVREYMGDSKSQTLHMRYLLQSTGRPISHQNVWLFPS